MDTRPQELIEELRRAIARTPDTAEQTALYQKLALLEFELSELARRQREVREADIQLVRAKNAQFGWRVVIGVLVATLVGLSLWLVASLWQGL